ncbi:MAG: hypothetical protein FWD57_12530 [Polyangiaceae bacterium]|nr:hypothetical protein [Polyangiaceae bacterium]
MKNTRERIRSPHTYLGLVVMAIACIAVGCGRTDDVSVTGAMSQSAQLQLQEPENSGLRRCGPFGTPNTVSVRWIAPSNDA